VTTAEQDAAPTEQALPSGAPSEAKTSPESSIPAAQERWGDRGAFASLLLGDREAAASLAPWRISGVDGYAADTVLDACRIGALEVRAASTRGPAHRCYGEPRQDDLAIIQAREGRDLVMAVADGVGNAARSHVGSREATRVAVTAVAGELAAGGSLDHEVAARGTERVARHLLDLAEDGDPRQLATTLTVGYLAVGDDHRFVLFGVGDSPAYLLQPDGFSPLGGQRTANPDELQSTETFCLPQDPTRIWMCSGRLGPGQALVLATDGLGNPLRDDGVRSYLGERWRTPPGPTEFLAQLQFRVRSHDDDRTAIVVWRTDPEGPA
jgi:serine/threonine protein phosphatase PrpC